MKEGTKGMQEIEAATACTGRTGAALEAGRDSWTVSEFHWAFLPEIADLVDGEPETIARIERWVGWQERAHGRAPIFRDDGTRVFDAMALGWAVERRHLDDGLGLS